MDIQQVASQLVSYLGKNPARITQFIEHPYSTTATATGSSEQISKKDMSQIVTAAAALSNNQTLGSGDVANIATALLGQNGDSVHALTSMLFGGGNTAQATAQAQAQTSSAGTLDLGSLVSMGLIAATLMNAAKPSQAAPQATAPQAAPAPQQGVNLADGLDLGEIASLAGQFLGGTTAAAAPQPAPAPQPATPSLDFGTIAQLASTFLKQ